MIRERGMFSNRYMARKGKENYHNGNEEDFPLAYTSNKYTSKERPSLTQTKKIHDEHSKPQQQSQQPQQPQQPQPKIDSSKFDKQLKQAKDQLKRVKADMLHKQTKHDSQISDLSRQLQQKSEHVDSLSLSLKKQQKKIRQLQHSLTRYQQTIKQQIYWLLKFFVNLQSGNVAGTQLKQEIENNYRSFHEYIQELGIQKELQQLASTSSIGFNQASRFTRMDSVLQLGQANPDSIFTEDLEDNHVIKLMELQPLIQTFNNNQYEAVDSKIAKRLFDDSKDSPLFRERGQNRQHSSINETYQMDRSVDEDNQFLPQPQVELVLPKEVKITKDFKPAGEQQNYIPLQKGQTLKLLRRIRDKLWIGEYGERLGLVNQDCFQL